MTHTATDTAPSPSNPAVGMPSSNKPPLHPGLADIVLSETRLSRVDGQRGELVLAGYAVEDIAPRVSFEAMIHLLWTGSLPDDAELAALRRALAERRILPGATVALLRKAAERRVHPMDTLNMATASLHLSTALSTSGEGPMQSVAPYDDTALRLLASMPLMVAAYERLCQGLEPLAPHPELGHAAQLLYLLHGEEPSDIQARALDTYLNTVIDHGANASTFTARVIISTDSDLVSAVVGALGALKGPLHGGAPGPALDMVFEIGEASRAEAYLRAKLARGERLMGFGHRVYRVRDPRAAVLEGAARDLYREGPQRELYELARQVEAAALRLLAEHKPERQLRTNVEFYTALVLHGLGLRSDLFTPLFALSRTAGWIGHAEEQRRERRLIRPRLWYVGPEPV